MYEFTLQSTENLAQLYCDVPDKYEGARTVLVSLLASLKKDLGDRPTLKSHASLVIVYHVEWVRFVLAVYTRDKSCKLCQSGFLAFLLRLYPKRMEALLQEEPALADICQHLKLTH